MSLNDIKFNRGQGGLGRRLQGEDHIAAIVACVGALNVPAETPLNTSTAIFSVEQIEALGVLPTVDNIGIKALHYHTKNFFAASPRGKFWVIIGDFTPATIKTAVKKVQNDSLGEVRQALVFNQTTTVIADQDTFLANVQAACDELEAVHKPMSTICELNFFERTDDLQPLRVKKFKNVSVCIGMDNGGVGKALNEANDTTITAAGFLLGILSRSQVYENIAWVGRNNVNDNGYNEFDKIRLPHTDDFNDLPVSYFDDLNAKGYIFLIRHIGTSGSYFNDSHTCDVATSDYAYIENNRVIDKAVRNGRTFLLPRLNSPLYVNEDGTLTEDTIAGFKNDVDQALEALQTAGEVSTFSTIINPEQNVLTSSKITVALTIVPVGVARNIVVNVGFAVRVA